VNYIKVFWHHSFPDEPVILYSEIDANRWERRKVSVFPDGKLGYASDEETTHSVMLSVEPLPTLLEIGSDAQFDPREIERQEFEDVWSRARCST
jgi:hypothetical protein